MISDGNPIESRGQPFEDMRIPVDELKKNLLDIFIPAGIDSYEAEIVANVLIWNELVGRSSQGLIRIPIYLKRLQNGLIKSPCRPEFQQKSEAIFLMKGNDGFGQFLGYSAMSKAIEIAKKVGVGIVGVADSNHFGSCSFYLQQAAEENQLSLVTSNSFPKVAPHGGMSAVLGTNPIAFGAPARNGQSILIDFSTGALAGSTIRKAIAVNEKLPEGAVIDKNERSVDNPKLASKGVMLPFGGAKGYGLGLMAEILSGIITGAAISHEVGSIYNDFERPNKVGHFFLALDISRICPLDTYFNRLEMLTGFIKKSKKREGVEEILLPGETRWRSYADHRKNGVNLAMETIEALSPIIKEFKLAVSW